MYTNYPFGVCLAHNGNLTNVKDLRESVFAEARHINTDSVRGALGLLLCCVSRVALMCGSCARVGRKKNQCKRDLLFRGV